MRNRATFERARVVSTCSLLLVAGLLGVGAAARAEEVGPVTIHGFASQGYLRSSANRDLSTPTDEGTFAFSEEALNFTVQPTSRLRIAVQLFARDLGEQGNHQVTIDWALGDYNVRDWLGIRAGKVKLPYGLYNTLIDADVARPEILQPIGVYPLAQRELTNAIDGASLYGVVPAGKVGDFEYELIGGSPDVNNSYILNRLTREEGAAALTPLEQAFGLSNANYQVSGIRGTRSSHWGGALEWRPRISGLRLRFSGYTGGAGIESNTTYTGFVGAAPISLATQWTTDIDVRHQLFFSAEYHHGGWRLSAEQVRSHTAVTTSVEGLPGPSSPTLVDSHSVATYGQVAYRFDDRWQASAYYVEYYTNQDDKAGARLVAMGQPAHHGFQKDLTLTLRSDITPWWLVKVEVHHINGTAWLSPVENPDGFTQHWTLFAAKTTFHF
jgi:hypothetical protein